MEFNASKTEEVIFSAKRIKPHHPNLFLGDTEVERKSEHKHLGLILDSKLDFKSHIREAIMKARRGMGIIRYLSRYVSRNVLDQVYKLYVRPHLDHGDIIYHRFDPNMSLDLKRKLEQTQYLLRQINTFTIVSSYIFLMQLYSQRLTPILSLFTSSGIFIVSKNTTRSFCPRIFYNVLSIFSFSMIINE